MGFDLVTWAPAIGGTGDNLYNIPGARKLDGTQDTNAQTYALIGQNFPYSNPPTLSEMSIGNGLNQVYAVCNYRAYYYDTTFGTTIGQLTYLASDINMLTTHITAAQTKINAIRVAEGFGSYIFSVSTPDLISGRSTFGDALAELRKALRFSGLMSKTIGLTVSTDFVGQNPSKTYKVRRTDHPLGTQVSIVAGSVNAATIAQFGIATGGSDIRDRWILSTPVPVWLTSGAVSAYLTTGGGLFNSSDIVSIDVYESNSDEHSANTASWSHTDNFLAAVSVDGLATHIVTLTDLTKLYAKANAFVSFIMATDKDIAAISSPGSDGTAKLLTTSLTVDFGA